jgi:predicted O-methyltransferase YrrM
LMSLRSWLRRSLQFRSKPPLRMLPGTQYQSVLLPLDYAPSRDYHPRWGYSHPVHPGMAALFAAGEPGYQACLQGLAALRTEFENIAHSLADAPSGQPAWIGGALNALDAAVLYYFVSALRPNTYLEIGSGISTLFAARAKADKALSTRIVSVDPEPRAEVDAVCDQVVRTGLESADLSIFDSLVAGDIVFLDGSHRSFMNSDVTVFMLDVLPRLKPGVVVQVHDVHWPHDYPPLFANWYWNEQYLLAVYLLALGPRAQILMPCSYLSNSPGLKQALTPILDAWAGAPETWLYGGSLWFRKSETANQ